MSHTENWTLGQVKNCKTVSRLKEVSSEASDTGGDCIDLRKDELQSA